MQKVFAWFIEIISAFVLITLNKSGNKTEADKLVEVKQDVYKQSTNTKDPQQL